jgi:hypothetical protein
VGVNREVNETAAGQGAMPTKCVCRNVLQQASAVGIAIWRFSLPSSSVPELTSRWNKLRTRRLALSECKCRETFKGARSGGRTIHGIERKMKGTLHENTNRIRIGALSC